MAITINGEKIEDEVIEGEFSQIKSHYEQTLQVSCCERDPEFRGYAKDNILARVLLSQKARTETDEPNEKDVTKSLEKLIEDNGGEERFYLQMGMPYKDEEPIRENLRQSIRVDQLLAKVCGDLPDPSAEEIDAFYNQNIELFQIDEEVRASHITKSLEGASSRAEAYGALREVRKELKAGADFDKLAEEHNSNGGQEIDLGFFKRGEFMEEFETIAFSMDIGEISPVFTTHLGFHVCVVTDRKDGEPIPLEEVKDKVLELMSQESREEVIQAYVDELKKDATIEDDDPDDEWTP